MANFEELIEKSVKDAIEKVIPGTIREELREFKESVTLRTYSIKETMEMTGFGYKRIRSAIVSGELPSIPGGRLVRIKFDDINRWMDAEKNKKRTHKH